MAVPLDPLVIIARKSSREKSDRRNTSSGLMLGCLPISLTLLPLIHQPLDDSLHGFEQVRTSGAFVYDGAVDVFRRVLMARSPGTLPPSCVRNGSAPATVHR